MSARSIGGWPVHSVMDGPPGFNPSLATGVISTRQIVQNKSQVCIFDREKSVSDWVLSERWSGPPWLAMGIEDARLLESDDDDGKALCALVSVPRTATMPLTNVMCVASRDFLLPIANQDLSRAQKNWTPLRAEGPRKWLVVSDVWPEVVVRRVTWSNRAASCEVVCSHACLPVARAAELTPPVLRGSTNWVLWNDCWWALVHAAVGRSYEDRNELLAWLALRTDTFAPHFLTPFFRFPFPDRIQFPTGLALLDAEKGIVSVALGLSDARSVLVETQLPAHPALAAESK